MTITSDAAQRAIAITESQQHQLDAIFADIALLGAAQRRLQRENEALRARVEALEAKVASMEKEGVHALASEADFLATQTIVDALIDKGDLSEAEEARLGVLGGLIRDYEEKMLPPM